MQGMRRGGESGVRVGERGLHALVPRRGAPVGAARRRLPAAGGIAVRIRARPRRGRPCRIRRHDLAGLHGGDADVRDHGLLALGLDLSRVVGRGGVGRDARARKAVAVTDETGRRVLTRRHVLVALLACAALAAAVTGRLLACAGCDYAIGGVPLFAAGSFCYLALGLLALVGSSMRLIGVLSLPGVMVQAGLARFLLTLGSPCVACLAAAAALFALSQICLGSDRRWRAAPGAIAILGVLALPLWSNLLVETERPAGLPEFAHAADLRPPAGDATLVVVYVREGCSFCRAFEREHEPRLAAEFGPAVKVRKVDARDRRGLKRIPSFLIRSQDGSLLVIRGLPRYDDLAARIRAAAGRNP